MAATSDGFVYAYRLDPEGGELDLIKQHNIGPKSDTSRASPTSTGSGGAAKSAEASSKWIFEWW